MMTIETSPGSHNNFARGWGEGGGEQSPPRWWAINSLQANVHDMMSQILSILIDSTQTSLPFFRLFFKSLNIRNSGSRRDIFRNGKR